ncbi:MAG: glycosyltransferase [Planctomycetota bacterium]|jgi:glycosyltransferase involved in cell wall biosynthesis
MRICLVSHGFPPDERAGVEHYTAALAGALADAGHRVDVFTRLSDPELPHLSLRRKVEQAAGGARFAVHWLNLITEPRDPAEALDPPGAAEAFDRFLECEQPEVIHFQHVVRLGLGLIEVAAERGLPVLYTAHDYFAVSDRFTLTRPDLAPYGAVPTSDQLARADLACARLNREPSLGSYHLGEFPEHLAKDVAADLAQVLDGEPTRAGFSAEEWEAARECRQALEERRGEVFRRVDRFLAPTRFLGERLVEGGLAEHKIQHLPYGIELERFAALDPPRPGKEDRPVRLAFVGSLTKHKGAHVLLEAYARLEPAAREQLQIELWGDSTDRVYVERTTARAAELGVRWRGGFDVERLPEVLAGIDVLCVPSLWCENYPFVIREAFAAGRPVVTSAFGALPESVEGGRDGLLFKRADAASLAACLKRFADEPKLVDQLSKGIRPVHTLAAQVDELVPLYEQAIAEAPGRWQTGASGLPHLIEVERAAFELARLPMRDLYARAVHGLARLRGTLDDSQPSAAAALSSLAQGRSRTQERLRDRVAEVTYLKGELDATREESARAASDLEAQVAGAAEERAWLEGQRQSLEGELQWLREQLSATQEERDWLSQEVENRDRRIAELGQEVASRAENEAYLGEERQRLIEAKAWLEEQWNKTRVALESEADQRAQLQSLEPILDRYRRETAELTGLVHRAQAEVFDLWGGSPEPLPGESDEHLDEVGERMRTLSDELSAMAEELRWRREEMFAAVRSANKPALRPLAKRLAVGRRVLSWRHSVGLNGSTPTPEESA